MKVQLNHKKMKKGEKIDVKAIGCREFHSMQELVKAIARTAKVMSWGARSWTKMSKYVLAFRVSAHRHKGLIYIAVNGADLFDVYLVSTHRNIKKVFNNVYVEDLLSTIDDEIEKIDSYAY
jgi:hypothetical protein